MADYGLFPEGFVAPTRAQLRERVETSLRNEFGKSLPLGNRTLLGFLVGVLVDALASLWEGLEQVNSAFDPDKAIGAALASLGLLTGTFRQPERASTAILTLCGDDGTVVDDGNVVATESTGKQFETDESVTITLLDSWATSASYNVGDRVTNAGLCFQCITAGDSAGSGPGPDEDVEDITDNTAHWRCIGEGEGAADIEASCLEIGDIVAVAGDLNAIQTPVAGWLSARNLEDAELGQPEQSDEAFRIFREADVARPGTGTPPAIRAAMLELPGVTSAIVFMNVTDQVDQDGLPPHSCEILVRGGEDQDIWDALWSNVPIGIQTIGDEEGTTIDEEGLEQVVRFSRPEEINVYVTVDLAKLPNVYGGDTAVEEAIVSWGDGVIGRNVVASAISAQCFAVPGVVDVTSVKIGTAPSPSGSATIVVSRRQLADYDTSRITVNSVDGSD